MKQILIALFVFCGLQVEAQRTYTTTQITSINSGLTASEGDLYMDTDLNELYIGLIDGSLYKVTSTDDQQIQTFDYDGTTNVLTIVLEDGGGTLTVNLSKLDQDLSYANTDPDDNTNTISISDGNTITIDDNHLGTNDQTLTALRNIDLNGNEMRVLSDEGQFRFLTSGNFYIDDDTSPIIMAQDNTNGVQTKLQSADNAGIIGTVSNHALQVRTNNLVVGTFEADGRFRLHNYGDSLFTGTMTNLLGVDVNGRLIEVDASTQDDQNLSDGGRSGVNQTIDITNGNSVTFSVADNDNDPNNEFQTIGKVGDLVTLSDSGGSFSDDHLGTSDQTLSANRTVDLNTRNLTFDGSTQDVTFESTGEVGIGIASPERPLHVNDAVRLSRGGNTASFIMDRYSGTLGTTMKSYIMGVNASAVGTGEFFIADYNENVSGGGYSRMLTLNDATEPVRFNQYNGTSFVTGNETALLGIEADGDIVEVNLGTVDDQDLSDGGRTGVNQTIDITNGNSVTFSVADNDNSSTNEIQTVDQFAISSNTLSISLASDGVGPSTVNLAPYLDNTDDQTLTYTNTDPDDNINTLQIEGSSVFNIDDNHLGTNNQTLTANRTINMSGRSLTFNGTQDVRIEADGDVGIGTTTPGARLDVDNGSVRFSDYGIGTYAETLPAIDSANYVLGVNGSGDIVEMNTVISSKVFYPPAIVIDVSTVSGNTATPGDESIDLHQEYITRFATPSVKSPSAPTAIPTYAEGDLHYYVTDYDTSVFANVEVSNTGVMTYDVISVPTNNCTFVNVVFVVK